ncbi:hypothetical protein [Roseomonas sp. WA12]
MRDLSDGKTADAIVGIHVAGGLETLNAVAMSETIDAVLLALPRPARPTSSG